MMQHGVGPVSVQIWIFTNNFGIRRSYNNFHDCSNILEIGYKKIIGAGGVMFSRPTPPAPHVTVKKQQLSPEQTLINEATMQLLEPNKTKKRIYTPEEYLALEETAEYKSEYHDGEIIPMTGGTTNHNRITLNFCRKFPYTIKGQSYEIFAADVRLWIPATRRYVYPHVMVIEGKPIYQRKNTTIVTNPTIIVEVLSKSTEGYDKTDKFRFYRSIPTFREYILIDQTSYHLEHYSKTGKKQWNFTEYDSENDIITLASVEFQITLNELYEQVDFSENEESETPETEIPE